MVELFVIKHGERALLKCKQWRPSSASLSSLSAEQAHLYSVIIAYIAHWQPGSIALGSQIWISAQALTFVVIDGEIIATVILPL